MEAAILTAKILSVVYIAFAFGFLLNWKYYKQALLKILDSPAFTITTGWIATALGVVILRYHNTWQHDWTAIVTVIGWIAIIKGVGLLVFPNEFRFYRPLIEARYFRWLTIIVMLGLGLLFAWVGFIEAQ